VATTTLTGTTGNDILNAPGSVTTLVAGLQGNDTITLQLQGDESNAGDGSDRITINVTGAASNTINGGSGNDAVFFGANIATFNGSIGLDAGNDSFVVTAAGIPIVGGAIGGNAGNDTIRFRAVGAITNALIGGGSNSDSISFDAAAGAVTNSTIFGGSGGDTLRFNGGAITTSTINAGDGHDRVLNTANNFGGANTVIALGKGFDSISLANAARFSSLAGGELSDTITIGNGFLGGAIFGGGLGNTTDADASGNEVISFTAGDVAGSTSIYGAGGNDTITFAAAAGQASRLLVDGGNGADRIGSTATTFGNAAASGLSIYGGAGQDTIRLANSVSANIFGGDGADSIYLGNGAGAGTSVNGGSGNDTINFSRWAAAGGQFQTMQTINGGGGADSIVFASFSAGAYTGAAAALAGGATNLNSAFLGNVVAVSTNVVRLNNGTATVSAAANFLNNQIFVAAGITAIGGTAVNAGFNGQGDVAVFKQGNDLFIAVHDGVNTSVNTYSAFAVIGGASILRTAGGFGTRAIASAVTFTAGLSAGRIGFTFA
jgi:hypothetical protein